MNLFTTYIYQPFFNVLVGIYWLLGQLVPDPDMGTAVIIFALIIRLILLPIDLAGDRSEDEKRAISEKIKNLNKEYANDPVRLKLEQKKVFRSNKAAILSETLIIGVQVIIILMLYRIFKTGLEGADLHLLYDFMPAISQPINLTFLGHYDLTRPNLTLNLIQSSLIFALEGLSMFFSLEPISRRQFISMGILMPIIAFIIFAMLPSGKKLFIITSLFFSINVLLVKQLVFWYHTYIVGSSKSAN